MEASPAPLSHLLALTERSPLLALMERSPLLDLSPLLALTERRQLHSLSHLLALTERSPLLALTEHSQQLDLMERNQLGHQCKALLTSLFCLLAFLKSPCLRLPLALLRTSMQRLIATLSARYCTPLATHLHMAVLDATHQRLAECTTSPLLHVRLHL